jgi:hypothetical protein
MEAVHAPVVQVLKICGTSRYQLYLSDGQEFYQFGLLHKHHDEIVNDGRLSKFAIIMLNKYSVAVTHTNK